MVDQLLFLLRSPWRKPGIAGGRRVMAGVFPRLRNGLPSSLTALVALLAAPCFAAPAYDREIAPILRTYCSGCHNDHDAESEFSVERFATLRKGGAGSGDPVVPGDAAASILVQRIKSSDSDHMPPDDEPQVPAADLATLEAWIAAGAAASWAWAQSAARPARNRMANMTFRVDLIANTSFQAIYSTSGRER